MSESCSVYWYCVRGGAAADVEILRRLQEQRAPRSTWRAAAAGG